MSPQSFATPGGHSPKPFIPSHHYRPPSLSPCQQPRAWKTAAAGRDSDTHPKAPRRRSIHPCSTFTRTEYQVVAIPTVQVTAALSPAPNKLIPPIHTFFGQIISRPSPNHVLGFLSHPSPPPKTLRDGHLTQQSSQSSPVCTDSCPY